MIQTTEIMNPTYFKVFRVYSTELAKHFERRGFEVIGTMGDDNVTKPTQFTVYGDSRRLTRRELPFIEKFGTLKKTKEHTYGSKKI